MNTQNHDRNVLLDEAVRRLLDEPVDEQSLAGALADTRQALHEAMRAEAGGVGSRTVAYSKWRQIMSNRMTKLAIAAAVVIAFVGVGSWLKLNNGKSGIAFADVMERISAARTVIYNMTIEGITVEGLSLPAITQKVMHIAPGRARMESPNGSVAIMVMDSSPPKSLMLMPSTKMAIRVDYVGGFSATNPTPAKDFFEELLKLRGQASENLGQQEIDGRQAVGFRARLGGFDWIVWVDIATGLPTRIEVSCEKMLGPGVKTVMHDFAFDVPLDESLFSLDPPPGYTLQTQQFEMPATKEGVLTDSLKICADLDLQGGQFPDKFDSNTMAEISKKLMKAISKNDKEASKEAMKKIGIHNGNVTEWSMRVGRISLGMMFVLALPADSDWHYAGAGVKLGQTDVPICWWKPVGSTTYRVIFGDLSTRDLNKADLDRLTASIILDK